MPQLLIGTFEGLTEADFDVYAPSRWANNLHNLDRMKAKERLLALLSGAREPLSGLSDLDLQGTSEVPSVWNGRKVQDQWAYLARPRTARDQLYPVLTADMSMAARIQEPSEHQRHLIMFVRLDEQHLEVGLAACNHATVDLDNLIARAEADADTLSGLLAELPEGVSLDGAAADVAVTVDGLLSAARATRAESQERMAVLRKLPRDEALNGGIGLMETVQGVLEGLLPLFGFMQWRPDNDHCGVGGRLEAFGATRAKHESELEARAKAMEAERAARAEEALKRAQEKAAERAAWREHLRSRPRPIREEAPRKPAPRSSEGEASVEGADEAAASEAASTEAASTEAVSTEAASSGPAAAEARPARKPRPERPRREDRPQRGPRKGERGDKPAGKGRGKPAGRPDKPAESDKPSAPLAVGDEVTLLRGLLAGKAGVITRIDKKKGLFEVKVGNLVVRVRGAELEKAG